MEKFLQKIYLWINRVITDFIRPYALETKEWMRRNRERREDKHEELITKILNWNVQGEEIVTVPNLLSILRPFLAGIAAIMQWYSVPWYFVGLVVGVALLTDKFDGAWAEIDGHTAFGEFLDPLCDKLALVIIALPFASLLSPVIFVTMIAIELALLIVAIVGLFLQTKQKKERTNFRSNIFGKTKFVLQSLGICLLVVNAVILAQILFGISIIFALLSIYAKVYSLAKP